MAEGNLIVLRPEELERLLFGTWLAGITDGEGSFILAWERGKQRKPQHKPKDRGTAMFRISLRFDDSDILEEIHRFLRCGWITHSRPNTSSPNAQPSTLFCVSKAADLLHTIIPIFESHPLRAKKQRDFVIWKKGVEILYRVAKRRRICLGSRRGFLAKWKDDEKAEFQRLIMELREIRKPETNGEMSSVPTVSMLPEPEFRPLSLFD